MTISAKVKNRTIILPPDVEIDDGETVSVIINDKKEVPTDPIWDPANWLDEADLVVDSVKQAERSHKNLPRKSGNWKGLLTVPDDFNEPLDDFKDYME